MAEERRMTWVRASAMDLKAEGEAGLIWEGAGNGFPRKRKALAVNLACFGSFRSDRLWCL